MVDPDCIFCQIVIGQSPAHILYQDDLVTAFQTIRPMAPVHVLIVPNHHVESVNDVSPTDGVALGHMTVVARQLARDHGVNLSGYRLVINTGFDAYQSVYHLHMHLIGGKPMPFRMVGPES
ncbi:MAG: histidine triad nucleotide-binding protein [Bellilinea sp.]